MRLAADPFKALEESLTMYRVSHWLVAIVCCQIISPARTRATDSPDVVGFWTLRGDCQDHSGHGLDGINHGVNLKTAEFDGRGSFIEVPDRPALHLGNGDFSITAEVYTDKGIDDCFGDLVSKFDSAGRKGFNLTLVSNTSGYNSQCDERQLFFGLDNATAGDWADCGRPGGKTNSTDALTVFDGRLVCGHS